MNASPIKRTVAVLVVLFLAGHFAASIVFQSPKGSYPGALENASDFYVRSAFPQNWKLFAPDPPQWERSIWVRFQDEHGNWSEFENPGRKWKESHRANRFSATSKLYRLNQNIAHYLDMDLSGGMSPEYGFGYYLLEKYLIVLANKKDSVRMAEAVLVVSNPGTGESMFYNYEPVLVEENHD